jgi:hypothetical protein
MWGSTFRIAWYLSSDIVKGRMVDLPDDVVQAAWLVWLSAYLGPLVLLVTWLVISW